MTNLDATARATAVTGYLQGTCTAAQGNACALLPVTVPVNIVTCDGSNSPVNTGVPWVLGPVYKVPLCQNGPGNVGWIDWTPPGGGTSELIGSIQTPNNPAIDLPSWNYVTETGNVNSAGVETALRAYDGEVVLIPQFDQTCGPGPRRDAGQHQADDQYAAELRLSRGRSRWQRQQPVVSLPELRLLPDVQQRGQLSASTWASRTAPT